MIYSNDITTKGYEELYKHLEDIMDKALESYREWDWDLIAYENEPVCLFIEFHDIEKDVLVKRTTVDDGIYDDVWVDVEEKVPLLMEIDPEKATEEDWKDLETKIDSLCYDMYETALRAAIENME